MTEGLINNFGYREIVRSLEQNISSTWEKDRLNQTDLDTSNPKRRYVLGMFPYPSGNAHMGHVRVYSLADVLARMGRFKGEEVFNPLGWDAFGLPAENAAFKNNVHPADWTELNIKKMRDEQLNRIGFSFDYSKEVNTSSPEFYKWTQWLFLKLYEKNLVYRSSAWVNWDPVDQTVLANEQVIDGKGWRTSAPVERRKLDQWFVRVTDFAEDLWRGIDELKGWSKEAIAAQRAWIGRVEGLEVDFRLASGHEKVSIFTSNPEMIYGAAAIVLTTEHPDASALTLLPQKEAIQNLIERTSQRSENDRRTGNIESVFTGRFAIHPLTGERLPLIVSSVPAPLNGVDATICVPAHNVSDAKLAETHGLPVVRVLGEDDKISDGGQHQTLMHSAVFDGLTQDDARAKISAVLLQSEQANKSIRYRLRDWAIARQRFWGAPIPMLQRMDGTWEPVPASRLPIRLPKDADFLQGGPSPLATYVQSHKTTDTQGQAATYEADTMDTFMCSSWYVWRFLDPHNEHKSWDERRAEKWMPIDYYIGGLEHANQHMIYFRFMSHFLYSVGLTPTKEPVDNFIDNGLVLMNGEKMSKSRGNIVIPDEVVDTYGADALRLYILSDSPHNDNIEWNEHGIKGKQKLLSSIYDLYTHLGTFLPKEVFRAVPKATNEPSQNLLRDVAQAQSAFEHDIDDTHSFNNAVAQLHSFGKKLRQYVEKQSGLLQPEALAFASQSYLKMLGVMAPHIADHLWRTTFDQKTSIFNERWIEAAEDSCAVTPSKQVSDVVITVNGKKRGLYAVDPFASDDDINAHFKLEASTAIQQRFTSGQKPDKIVVVRSRDGKISLINLATNTGPK